MVEPGPPESQPQRTRFAWRRTSLALVAGVLLSIAVAVHRRPSVASLAVVAAVLAVAAAGLAVAEHRARELTRFNVRRMHGTAALIGLTACAIGALGAVLIVITSG